MSKSRLSKRLAVVCLMVVLALTASLAAACAGTPQAPPPPPPSSPPPPTTPPAEPEEVIEVRVLRPFPVDFIFHHDLRILYEYGDKISGGRLVFKDLGGTEVAPAFEQLKYLQAGRADLLATAASYPMSDFYEGGILNSWIGTADPTKLRDTGFFDALDRMAREKVGLTVLGSPASIEYYVYSAEPITSLADFQGLKLRSSGTYDPLFDTLGAAVVVTPPGGTYSALETGVFDGLGWPGTAVPDMGWAEFVPYQLYPPFSKGTGMVWYANAEWFDGLPQWAQDAIINSVKLAEQTAPGAFLSARATETRFLREQGMEPTLLSEDEWWQVMQIVYETTKEKLRENVPENAEELITYLDMFYPPEEVWWPLHDWR